MNVRYDSCILDINIWSPRASPDYIFVIDDEIMYTFIRSTGIFMDPVAFGSTVGLTVGSGTFARFLMCAVARPVSGVASHRKNALRRINNSEEMGCWSRSKWKMLNSEGLSLERYNPS